MSKLPHMLNTLDELSGAGETAQLADELQGRKSVISWWGNICFEKSFTASGCIPVFGGLEVASDRLLTLMQKGVSVELRTIGITSVVVAVLSIFPSLVSGVGALLALFALLISGISALHGERRYVWATLIVVTIDLGVFSVLPELQNTSKSLLAMLVGIPYAFVFIYILIGFRQR